MKITRWVCVCDHLLNTGCDITQWWPTFLTKEAEFVILIISACMYVSLWLTGLTTLWFITLPPNGSPPCRPTTVCVCARVYTCARECVSADSVSREVYYSLRSSASSGVMGQTARLHRLQWSRKISYPRTKVQVHKLWPHSVTTKWLWCVLSTTVLW